MISHNEEFVGALCPEQWHVSAGRLTHKGHLAVALDRFDEGSRPGSAMASGIATPSGTASPIPGFASPGVSTPALAGAAGGSPGVGAAASPALGGISTPSLLAAGGIGGNSPSSSVAVSAVNSADENEKGELKFRAKKKKKMTRAQLKEREARRRLRHIDWLNSPKGTPRPVDTDDEG